MTETEITAGLVRELLEDQHPDLAALPLSEVEGGWGNQMWRLGDELAVRIQRMETEPDRQLKERRWLPLLAPHLPLPIPVPVRSGAPSRRFPKLWTVMTWVPGVPLDCGSITRGKHAAETLAAFLRALHVPAPADAPVDTGRGAHPKDGRDGFEYFFGSLDGDAIGFDDLGVGDPAADLAAAWVLLPDGEAAPFFAAYATADEATIRRARGQAALKSLFLMLMGQNGDHGLPGGKPAWGPAGRAALDRVLSGV